MNNPEWLETFIEEEGFTPIAEDQYECAGGHVWHIDEIKDLWHQENKTVWQGGMKNAARAVPPCTKERKKVFSGGTAFVPCPMVQWQHD